MLHAYFMCVMVTNDPVSLYLDSGTVAVMNSSGHTGHNAAGDEEAAASECSESAQSSSLGPEGKLSSQYPELALILAQIHEIKEDICTIREDLEGFKVIVLVILIPV